MTTVGAPTMPFLDPLVVVYHTASALHSDVEVIKKRYMSARVSTIDYEILDDDSDRVLDCKAIVEDGNPGLLNMASCAIIVVRMPLKAGWALRHLAKRLRAENQPLPVSCVAYLAFENVDWLDDDLFEYARSFVDGRTASDVCNLAAGLPSTLTTAARAYLASVLHANGEVVPVPMLMQHVRKNETSGVFAELVALYMPATFGNDESRKRRRGDDNDDDDAIPATNEHE
jgi:hypothetical protein